MCGVLQIDSNLERTKGCAMLTGTWYTAGVNTTVNDSWKLRDKGVCFRSGSPVEATHHAVLMASYQHYIREW